MKRMWFAAVSVLIGMTASPVVFAQNNVRSLDDKRLAELVRLEKDPEIQRLSAEWSKASNDAVRQRLREVAARGDARSLLAAALLWRIYSGDEGAKGVALWQPGASPEARAWFEAARSLRPRDTLVAWVESLDCSGLSETCDASAALQFLLQAEAGNAAVHLQALADAKRKGATTVAMDARWSAAHSATYYNPHYQDLGRLLAAALREVPWPPLPAPLVEAYGSQLGLGRPARAEDLADTGALAVSSMLSMPGFMPLMKDCTQEATAARKEACKHVLTLVAQDRSIIGPMIALPTLLRLHGDIVESEAWREQLRQACWLHEVAAPLSMSNVIDGVVLPKDYMSWVLTEGDMAAMRRLLEVYGKPVQAPTDWLPSNERYRALVVGEPEPKS